MNRAIRTAALMLVAIFALTTVAAVSATKKKPVPKKRIVLGTTQLKGNDDCKIGETYTLGKTNPINVTMNSMEYSVDPIAIGNSLVTPRSDQKLLILNYTLHNPKPMDRGIGWSTLEITAVDADNTNWRYITAVGMKDSGQTCNMTLKPGQKTEVYTSILVPAKGEIPKLILQGSDKLVMRYNLIGKVKPLPAPIADPADPSGATALEKVPAKMGTFYMIKTLNAKIDSAEFSSGPINGREPATGTRFLVIKGTAKNTLSIVKSLVWSTFKPKITDTDGGGVNWNGSFLYASRDDNLNAQLEPGQEIRFRWYFQVGDNVQPSSLALSEGAGRTFIYDLSSIK